MKIKLSILAVLLSVGLWADSTALFGFVTNISKNDTLNVRSQANHKSKKVGELPFDAGMGIEKCKTVKSSTWCRVYPLVQNFYDKFWEEKNIGWVNARYLKFRNHGYVLIKGERNCAYALDCYKGKCEVVDDFSNESIVDYQKTGIKTKWVKREYLRGESNFGVTPDNVDGYCNNGVYIDEYLKKSKSILINNSSYSKIDSKRISLSYPSFMKAKKGSNEDITVSHSVKLEHYSGSDMRDDRDILFERTLFNYNFRIFDTLEKALQTTFPYYKNSELIEIMHYNSNTDWFANVKSDGFVTSDNFYGKEAYRIMIGTEGAGILYHFYRQKGKIVLATTYFDSNPPLDPQNDKVIKGKWSLPDENKIIKYLITHLKVK